MKYHITATNGRETKVIRWRHGLGAEFTRFADRETAEIHAAVVAACTPELTIEVQEGGSQ